MSYIDKNNNASMYENLHLGYIKNANGQTTNPRLNLCCKVNLITNEVSDIDYDVVCYDDKDTLGYYRSTHDNYADAKEAYDKLFEFHVE